MSILVWIMPGGHLHQSPPLTHYLADVICSRLQTVRFFPGGYRLAYRLRIRAK